MLFGSWKRRKEEKKENNEIFDAVLDALKFIKVELATHDKEIELIKLKFQDKLFKKKLKEEPEEETTTKQEHQIDQFADIRKLRKEFKEEKFGL